MTERERERDREREREKERERERERDCASFVANCTKIIQYSARLP